MAFTYVIKCKDDTLYTGIAKDIKKRMKEHINRSPKAKYTRSRPISELCALWESESMSCAAKLEYAVKKLKRAKKLELIEHPESVEEFFPNLEREKYKTLPVFDVFSLDND